MNDENMKRLKGCLCAAYEIFQDRCLPLDYKTVFGIHKHTVDYGIEYYMTSIDSHGTVLDRLEQDLYYNIKPLIPDYGGGGEEEDEELVSVYRLPLNASAVRWFDSAEVWVSDLEYLLGEGAEDLDFELDGPDDPDMIRLQRAVACAYHLYDDHCLPLRPLMRCRKNNQNMLDALEDMLLQKIEPIEGGADPKVLEWKDWVENIDPAQIMKDFHLLGNHEKLAWVCDNAFLLKRHGIYEECLEDAYTAENPLMRECHFTPPLLLQLFRWANKDVLRSFGDPLPEGDSITLYRGVRNVANTASIRSVSWTSSPNVAAWFAMFLNRGTEPGVYTVTVPMESVFLHTNERKEAEFVIEVPKGIKTKRVLPMPEPTLPDSSG